MEAIHSQQPLHTPSTSGLIIKSTITSIALTALSVAGLMKELSEWAIISLQGGVITMFLLVSLYFLKNRTHTTSSSTTNPSNQLSPSSPAANCSNQSNQPIERNARSSSHSQTGDPWFDVLFTANMAEMQRQNIGQNK